jgi:hypothetical protein
LCRGYFVDIAGKKRKIIAEYIRNNLEKRYVLVKVIRKRVSRLV